MGRTTSGHLELNDRAKYKLYLKDCKYNDIEPMRYGEFLVNECGYSEPEYYRSRKDWNK